MEKADLSAETSFHYDSWYVIALFFLFWRCAYTVLCWHVPRDATYCSRIVAFVHGLILAFVGTNQCFVIDVPFEHPEWRTTQAQKRQMAASLGYFIHDTIYCFMHERQDKVMLVHHSYSMFALYKMLYRDQSGAQATCALGCLEISNPALQIRWFLRSEGFYPSVFYTAVEFTFLIVFFFVRIVLGTYFIVVVTLQPKNYWDFRVLAAVIYLISWIFFGQMVRYVLKKYRKKDQLVPP